MAPAPYTLPDPDHDWIPEARRTYVRRTLRLALDWPHPLPGWLAAPYGSARAALADAWRRAPERVAAMLMLPTIGAPLHGGALEVAMPNLLLELARARLVEPQGVWWAAPIRSLLSPSLRVARRYEPALVGALFLPGSVAVAKHEDWPLTDPGTDFLPLAHGGWLATADANPLAMVEAHPEKHGNQLSFGDTSHDTLVCRLDEARALVAETLPELAREHASMLATVVPVGADPLVSLSASYREAIGQVYLSLHPGRETMAEALVHEIQHNKLNLLSYGDRLLENADGLYESPVRPDPRPLWGVLLAVHAFIPVEAMYQSMCHPRLEQVRRLNREGMAVLREAARPTPVGKRLLEGMDAWLNG